jgi:diguanylate cyclase (GGDEF)-like protein
LTGLPNRRLLLDRLQHLFVRVRRNSDHPYALLLGNVDHFKVFNETLGPIAGDHVLGEIARRMGACLRQDDTVAQGESANNSAEPVLSRLGGDDFAILLDGVREPTDAMRVAGRIQAAVAEPSSSTHVKSASR